MPWLVVTLLALPGVALGTGGGLIGLASPLGIALFAAGIAYLAVDLAFLQPRVAAAAVAGGRRERAADAFLERSLVLTSIGELADELARAVATGAGPTRIYLLAPAEEGGVRLRGPAGSDPPELSMDTGPALQWLSRCTEPVTRGGVQEAASSGDAGAVEVGALLSATGCDAAMPLHYRGALLGVAIVDAASGSDEELHEFYRSLRAYAAVALANSFLGAQASGGAALASTVHVATAAQESILPDERVVATAGYALKGLCRSAAECGGDVWNYRELPDGRLLVVLGDATGHGMAPALLAASASGAIDGVWQADPERAEPAELLRTLNRAVHRTGRKRYMMTAFALVFDPESGELVYANAGQNFPYIITGDKVEALVARGDPLGSSAEASFESASRTLAPGQRLLLFTDGIVEAAGPRGNAFGERRFRAAVAEAAGDRLGRFPERILAAAKAHIGDAALEDDVTLVALERTARETGGGGSERETSEA